MTLLDTFNGLATIGFVLGSAVVSCRLLLLARRSRGLPELLLGCSIGGTAVLGYGALILALTMRGGAAAAEEVGAGALALTAMGRILHDLGVTSHIAFVLYVFRRDAGWAKALAVAMLTLLWVGCLVGTAQGGLRVSLVGSPAWLAEYVVIWTYPIWSMLEAFRYGLMLRRREAVGLASPLVVNRFFLWGTGSFFATVAIWISSIAFLYESDPERLAAIEPAVRICTAAAGLVSVTCSLFAFVPPGWYRRWIEGTSGPAAQRV